MLVDAGHARLGGFGRAHRIPSFRDNPAAPGVASRMSLDVHGLGFVLTAWMLGRSPLLNFDEPYRSDFAFDLPDDPALGPLLAAMTSNDHRRRPPAAEVERALRGDAALSA